MRKWLILLLLYSIDVRAEPEPITLKVNPRVCSSSCTVWVIVTIEKHPDNRRWILIWDSETFSGLSENQLDGEHSPRIFQVYLEDLPEGIYLVEAGVYRSEWHIVRTKVYVGVISTISEGG